VLRTCRWIGAELKDPSKVDGTIDTPEFVEQVVEQIIPEQRIAALDLTFAETPARWWATHKATLHSWEDTAEALNTPLKHDAYSVIELLLYLQTMGFVVLTSDKVRSVPLPWGRVPKGPLLNSRACLRILISRAP
jgi:hypothetical protein